MRHRAIGAGGTPCANTQRIPGTLAQLRWVTPGNVPARAHNANSAIDNDAAINTTFNF